MAIAPLRRLLRARDVDVVHVNLTSFPACRPAPWAALLARKPMVLLDHGPTPGLTWKGRARQRVLTRLAAARVAVGVGAARDAERWGGLRPGSVRPIPNGVPAPTLAPRPARPARPVVLGVAARLSPEKGVDVAVRALADVPDAVLTIAGDGPERPALEALAASTGVGDRVRFLGWQPDPGTVLAGVDVVVVPSRSEGLPLVVLEAMHAGLPVVASDVGSVAEAVATATPACSCPPPIPSPWRPPSVASSPTRPCASASVVAAPRSPPPASPCPPWPTRTTTSTAPWPPPTARARRRYR